MATAQVVTLPAGTAETPASGILRELLVGAARRWWELPLAVQGALAESPAVAQALPARTIPVLLLLAIPDCKSLGRSGISNLTRLQRCVWHCGQGS